MRDLLRRARCKDCAAEGITTARAPHPGPRCSTHHRARLELVRQRDHAGRIEVRYGLTAADYAAILEAQGGRCFWCRIATGKVRRLAVDHDHGCDQGHPPDRGCRACVRGLLCGACNRRVGLLGDDAGQFRRMATYIETRPAALLLAQREGQT